MQEGEFMEMWVDISANYLMYIRDKLHLSGEGVSLLGKEDVPKVGGTF